MPLSVHIVEIGRNATDGDIFDQMRIMKRIRETKSADDIVCTLRGFDSDPRELFEIPEARSLCVRLVDLGFISYLSFASYLNPTKPELGEAGYGAMEVWMCSNDRLRGENETSPKLFKEAQAVVIKANAAADSALGPMAG
jgi:hypothetical protein